MNNRLINTKVSGGGGGCTDIVDNYDPFGGNGVALYQLNGNANDVSGNYNGSPSNITYGTGVFGQAAQFNGSNSGILINDSAALRLTGSYTVSFWFKINSTGSLQRIINKDDGNDYSAGYSFFIQPVGGFGWTHNDGSNNQNWDGIFSPSVGVWYNICAVYSDSSNLRTLYVNGASVASIATNTNIAAGTDSLNFGYIPVYNQRLNGSLDQVRIFNTALTPLEIEALYTEELCICGGTVDTLDILGDGSCIATYQLDGNANDLSGNYSGTPTNVSYGVGEFDLAGVFNGSSSEITISSTSTSPVNFSDKNYTISAWIKTTQTTTSVYGSLLTKYGSIDDNRSFGVFFRGSDGKVIFLERATGATEETISNASVNDGAWHNIVVVKTSNTKLIYIDGSLDVSKNTTFTPNSGSSEPLRIGSTGGTTNNRINGSIDQVRIFNKALNSTEVTTLYNETACTKVTRTAGATQILGDSSCVAYYKLDGDVTDETNTYNGTVVGTISYADGEFDYTADFDYSNNYINTNCPLLWDNVQGNITPITISCWIKGQGYSGTGSGWIAMAGYFAYIRKTSNNEIVIQTLSNTGGSLNLITSSAILNNTDWFHIVGVWNFKTIKLYINGQFIGEDTGTAGFSGDQQITKNILIGKWNLTSQNQGYLGEIDQFRVFNKEVSASEVTTLYNEGI